MKKRLTAPLLCAAVIGLGAYFLWMVGAADRVKEPASDLAEILPAGIDAIHLEADKGLEKVRSHAGNPFPEVARSRALMTLEDDPFNAESAAEQQWLDKHGFPNASQWDAYRAASDGLLKQASDAGDPVAGTMLDARRLPDKQALDSLLLSAVDGNNFALQLLAAHYAERNSPVNAYAVSRVSEIRGDLPAGLAREFLFRRALTQEERVAGESEALQLNASLNRLYREKHGVSFTPDVRPITINGVNNE